MQRILQHHFTTKNRFFCNFLLLKNVFADISDKRFKENHCAVINPRLKYGWNSYLCESGLPFVCKKYLSKTENETLGKCLSVTVSCLWMGKESKRSHLTIKSAEQGHSWTKCVGLLAQVEYNLL